MTGQYDDILLYPAVGNVKFVHICTLYNICCAGNSDDIQHYCAVIDWFGIGSVVRTYLRHYDCLIYTIWLW